MIKSFEIQIINLNDLLKILKVIKILYSLLKF